MEEDMNETDYEKLKRLFRDWGLGCTTVDEFGCSEEGCDLQLSLKDGQKAISLEYGHTLVGAYVGFFCVFVFNEDGTFATVGIGE